MKNVLILSLILFGFRIAVNAQQAVQKPTNDKIVAEMTEVWDPEVKIIQPGLNNSDPPSDAIILFNGTDVNGVSCKCSTGK